MGNVDRKGSSPDSGVCSRHFFISETDLYSNVVTLAETFEANNTKCFSQFFLFSFALGRISFRINSNKNIKIVPH